MDSSGGRAPPPPAGQGAPPPPSPSPVLDEQEQYKTHLPIDGIISNGYQYSVFLLSNYGWYLLLGIIILVIIWSMIKPSILRWLEKREERLEEANFDPVKAEHYQDAMLRSREKMQRELEEKAREHQAKVEEKQAEERDERIKQWEEFKVVTKKSRSSKPKDKPPLNSRDYFPLGGRGGGGGYRPQRRTLQTGGGGG